MHKQIRETSFFFLISLSVYSLISYCSPLIIAITTLDTTQLSLLIILSSTPFIKMQRPRAQWTNWKKITITVFIRLCNTEDANTIRRSLCLSLVSLKFSYILFYVPHTVITRQRDNKQREMQHNGNCAIVIITMEDDHCNFTSPSSFANCTSCTDLLTSVTKCTTTCTTNHYKIVRVQHLSALTSNSEWSLDGGLFLFVYTYEVIANPRIKQVSAIVIRWL